ncbi:hypothetical protein GCM10020295_03370 [Streptomyces cinereospinus]
MSVVNDRPTAASGLNARVTLFTTDGTARYDRTVTGVDVEARGVTTTSLALPAEVPGLDGTYLARLLLTDATGRELSRNVYWLSTRDDVLDYAKADWYHTPTTSYADLTGLASMPRVALDVTATTTTRSGTSTTTVTLRHPGTTAAPALLTDVDVVSADGRTPALPVHWTDNHVSLWPGESATLVASYRTADADRAPRVRVAGWNARPVTVPSR